jgi:NAD(P)-dependent dehydrogenase (short-subunit alcohol dehydrogenase family)
MEVEGRVLHMDGTPLIGTGKLNRSQLAHQVAVVTGAGRGIGFETARALAWLGARVVIAEIDENTGASAANSINSEMGSGSALFLRCDVGNEDDVARLRAEVLSRWGPVDIVINNATVAPLGAVKDTPIEDWDLGYRVIVRGPVLLAKAFIPSMVERNRGVFVCIASSGSAPFMGPYEVFKIAQGGVASTLDMELEDTGVVAFTIGPGISPTPGAAEAIARLAPMYGKSVQEFYEMSKAQMISPEAAGAGFAAAVALAEQFRGQETSSFAALKAAGIELPGDSPAETGDWFKPGELDRARELCAAVLKTLEEQHEGFKKRSLFERQWVLRDFKKNTGMPVEQWIEALQDLDRRLNAAQDNAKVRSPADLNNLVNYLKHMQDLLSGWEKDPKKLEETMKILKGWEADAAELRDILA